MTAEANRPATIVCGCRGVGLAAWDLRPDAFGCESDVLALDRDEFGPAQRTSIAEQQQQGAVAQVGEAAGAAGVDTPPDLGLANVADRRAGGPAVFTVDVAEGVVDHRVAGEGMPRQAVVLADGGEPLGERGAAEGGRQTGQVVGHRLRRRQQRGPSTQLTPLGEGLSAGLVSAQCRRGQRGVSIGGSRAGRGELGRQRRGRVGHGGIQQLAAIEAPLS